MNLFIRLIKWALQAFDIYTITVPGIVQGLRLSNQARARSKEETEVLEHFNGIVRKYIQDWKTINFARFNLFPFFPVHIASSANIQRNIFMQY